MPALRKLSTKLAIGGAWFDFSAGSYEPVPAPVDGHICLLVARADNPRFRSALSRACQPHAKALRDGKLSPDVWEQLQVRALAEGVLVGWENITEADETTPVPYSVERAMAFLADPALFELRQFVQDASGFATAYQQEVEEAQRGN